MTHKGEITVCSECGYSFLEKKSSAENASTESTENNLQQSVSVKEPAVSAKREESIKASVLNARDTVDQWQKEKSPFFHYVFEFFGACSMALGIPTLLVSLLLLIIWVNGLGGIVLFVIGALGFVLSMVSFQLSAVLITVTEMIATRGILSWSKQNGIDLMPVLEKTFYENVDNMKFFEARKHYKKANYVLSAQYEQATHQTKAKELLVELAQLVCIVIECVLGLVFVFSNYTLLATNPTSFGDYRLVLLLIICVVMAIISQSVFAKLEKNRKAGVDFWVQKNFPPKAYTKYVANVKRAG